MMVEPLLSRLIKNITVVVILSGSLLSVRAGSFKEVTDFGENPTHLKMYLFEPDNVVSHPPVLVGMHWCHGTAERYYLGNKYASYADQYGFIIIYPNANSGDSCFDVHSESTLLHDGGGDSRGIASMIRYVIKEKHADSTRVYVTGHSSGGMMTEVMAGAYPELFESASASAGVPFSCFAGEADQFGWSSKCANGQISRTPEAWGNIVRAAYPGYSGKRPRMQLWHGTNDNILKYVNFEEAIKQWVNVLGLSLTPSSTEPNTPIASCTRYRYQDSTGNVLLEAIKVNGQDHNMNSGEAAAREAAVLSFLGLDMITPVRRAANHEQYPKKYAETHISFKRITSESIGYMITGRPGHIRAEAYNLNGMRIATLTDRYCITGTVEAVWNHTGELLPAEVVVVAVTLDGWYLGCTRLILAD